MVKSLWASVQGDPIFMRQVNGWLTIFWALNFPPVIALYVLIDNEAFQRFCLLYLALVSIWANVAGHWSAWQASRVEVRQEEEAKKRDDEDLAEDVLQRLVERTELNEADQA